MLFNSYEFILIFLPVAVAGYFCINRTGNYNAGLVWLIISSLFFYGYYNPVYLLLIVSSLAVNYAVSVFVERPGIGKPLLALGVLFDLGLLFYYKYYNFFAENANAFLRTDLVTRDVILPLGISFFTFQQLSYLLDRYHGDAEKYSFIEYAAFITFFPQLIAGPIVFHDELVPQLRDGNRKNADTAGLSRGLYAFACGLAKKVLIADTLSMAVNAGIFNLEMWSFVTVLAVMASYSLQLYFDFSGYCDMAYGIGLMFNLNLPMNFNSPYKADSIGDFWRRWHITLTRFFRKYVYIPLGGSRKGVPRTLLNTLIVFTLSGLWHGANWTFVLWGFLNGIMVCVSRSTGSIREKLPKMLRVPFTFAACNVMWLLFRSDTVGDWRNAVLSLGRFKPGGIYPVVYDGIYKLLEFRILERFLMGRVEASLPGIMFVIFVALALAMAWFSPSVIEKTEEFEFKTKNIIITWVLLIWSMISLSGITEFLYFDF